MDILLRIKKEEPQVLIICECIRFILLIVILILTYNLLDSLSFSRHIFQDLMKNWQNFPIEDIILSRICFLILIMK